MQKRLHWGCGPKTIFDWVNSDIQMFPGVNVVADIRQGLPFPDNTFECIVSIHALPELTYREMDPALGELRRILRPGGVLRLGLPDLDKALKAYLSRDIDYFLIGDDQIRNLAGKLIVQMTWYGQSRCMFTEAFMEELLKRNGFNHVQFCDYQKSDSGIPGITLVDDRPLESFFVEARK